MLNVEEKANEMKKESGIDLGRDDDESSSGLESDGRRSRSSSVASPQSSPGIAKTRSKTPLTGRQRQRLRFQARLMLLKQQQEQSRERSEKASTKILQPGSNRKSQSLTQLVDSGCQQIEANLLITNNSVKNQTGVSRSYYRRHSKGSNYESSSDFVISSLSPEEQMKFNLLKTSLSFDMGFADDASPSSSTTSISEISEQTDPFLLGNVVEVKAVDELPEEISELLCQASYPEGVSELVRNGSGKLLAETSSSCPSETAAQPKYRGGRKKEAPPPNMTPEQRVQWEKERQKKDNHNHIERRRRDKINECIRLLALIVPNGDDNTSSPIPEECGSRDAQKKEYNKKGAVLEAAVNYIKRLQSEQKQMEEFRRQQEMLQRANRSLLLEIQQLQNRAQHVHISSPDSSPTVLLQQATPHQYQPQFEPQPGSDQEHLHPADMYLGSLQLLMTPCHSQAPQIEIPQQHLQEGQQNLFLDEIVSFVQDSNSECHPLVVDGCRFGGNQFETISENVFFDELGSGFQDLTDMDHDFISIIPDQAAAISDFSVDDFFNVESVQLNGDPLLSNATDEPMASDFDELFIPLALR